MEELPMGILEVVSIVFGIVGVVLAGIFGYASFKRGKTQDIEQDGHKNGMMMTELGYIKSGVDDIKRKQEKQAEQHIEVITRLTAVEESAKQAHKRIDELNDK